MTDTQTQVHFTTSITLHSSAILEMIEKKAAAKQPFFEEAVTVCLDAAEKMDEARWMIGDMALLITSEKHYGADAVGQFAKRINVAVDSVQDYRMMAAYYEKSARADILGQMAVLSYSHFKVARRLKDLGGLPASIAFLTECADNSWTIEAARLEMDKRLGKEPKQKEQAETKPEPLTTIECYITEITGTTMTLNATNVRGIVKGKLYRLEVYETDVVED